MDSTGNLTASLRMGSARPGDFGRILVEALESRCLLSNPPFAVFKHGALAVHGTSGDDSIGIDDVSATNTHAARLRVDVNSVSFSYSLRAIRTLHVYGDAGHDSITMFSLDAPRLRGVTLYGGAGIDDIYLYQTSRPSFRLVAHGGADHDLIVNNGYATALCGDAGDDWIIGNDSGEVISGGDGNDDLRGTYAGTATPGGVTIHGGAGDDELLLQTSTLEHVLLGAASEYGPAVFSDSVLLDGGPGNDFVFGHVSAAGDEHRVTLAGGDGADHIYPFGNEVVADATPSDVIAGDDLFSGAPAVVQTATLDVTTAVTNSGGRTTTTALAIPAGTGDHGTGSPITMTDASGTLTMRGPAGSTFTVKQFFDDAGFPLRLLGPFESGFSTELDLSVNGVNLGDALTYSIQAGDRLSLTISEQALG